MLLSRMIEGSPHQRSAYQRLGLFPSPLFLSLSPQTYNQFDKQIMLLSPAVLLIQDFASARSFVSTYITAIAIVIYVVPPV